MNIKDLKRKPMKNYICVLCYDKDGQASFLRTKAYTASNDEEAYGIGGKMLDNEHPEEVKKGYNNWIINIDELGREVYQAKIGKAAHLPRVK